MRRASALVWLLIGLWAPAARAEDPAPEPNQPQAAEEPKPKTFDSSELEPEHVITGIEEPGREEGDAGRDFANALLFVPRNIVDLMFEGTAAAANLIADEQLVPRYQRALGAPPGGRIFIFPTILAETSGRFDVGARFIADTPHVTTFQRFGFGGTRDIALESRALFKGSGELPFAISLEAFYELESRVEYHGLGIDPETDPRNAFVLGNPHRVGLFKERQARGLGSLGLRWGPSFEFFLSGSISRRQVEDTVGAGQRALSQVFVPGSVPGTGIASWIGYGEAAARFDTRELRGGRPNPGLIAEGYTGGAHSTEGPDVAFMRLGWRLAGFIPIYRRTNILSPRFVFDRLVPLGGLEVPFNELPRQPEFRGFDTRRDFVSMVASLDYTWQLARIVGLRVFADAATVAPSVADFGLEQLKGMHFAGGFGIDLFSGPARLASASIAISPEGARLLFALGTPQQFGDRQHQN